MDSIAAEGRLDVREIVGEMVNEIQVIITTPSPSLPPLQTTMLT